MHRASTIDEARGRAEGSPLHRAGAATFEVAEWRLEAGEVGGQGSGSRIHDPDAPTVAFKLP